MIFFIFHTLNVFFLSIERANYNVESVNLRFCFIIWMKIIKHNENQFDSVPDAESEKFSMLHVWTVENYF